MSLRSDMEAYARSGELSERLCIEIAAYGAIMLDDTWAEAVHKDVTSISRRGQYQTFAFRASTLRLRQNIEFADATQGMANGVAAMMKSWTAVVRRKQLPGNKIRAVRKPRQAIFNSVYRTGEAGLADWSCLALLDSEGQDSSETRSRSMPLRLKVEYVSAVLSLAGHVTLPIVPLATADEAAKLPIQDARRVLDDCPGHSYLTFQVISGDVANKRFLKTEKNAKGETHGLPLVASAHDFLGRAIARGPRLLRRWNARYC